MKLVDLLIGTFVAALSIAVFAVVLCGSGYLFGVGLRLAGVV